jgi:hypothetical protein
MKQILPPCLRIYPALKYLFVLTLLLFTCATYAQSPADFSGVWIQDPAKSDDFYKSFEVKYTIRQTAQVFTVSQILTMKGTTESVTNEYTYTLDGKVTTMDKEGGKEKELAQWSSDKKILTTRSTKTYGNEEVGFTETYSLSDNGLVLTVQKSNIIPGALTIKQVFNKKQ